MKVVTDAGEVIELGTTEATPTIGMTDFSRRVTDDFGVTTVVERGFARRLSVRLAVPFEAVDELQRRLADLRATPARWIADERFASLDVQGFYKDFALDLAVPPLSYCTLTIEGLVETAASEDVGIDPAPEGAPSTLQLIQPVLVTDAVLVDGSVAEADYPEWSGETSYAAGDRVVITATHRIYESSSAGNVGNDPAGVSGRWIDAGSTNRWAMFDQALGSATTAVGSIAVTLDPGTVDAIALLDVSAATVRVEATEYDRTILAGAGAITFLDLPIDGGQIIVTIAGDGDVSVGTLLIGRLVALGLTESSPTAGIADYSRKAVDDFGEVTIVRRAWAKRMTARALIRTDALDTVVNRIAVVRARPSLWIGQAGLDSLTVYGFFKDFAIEVGEAVSKLSLSIEGLSAAAPLAPLELGEAAWPDVTDPDGTKPDDNATNSADPASPFGNGTVAGAQSLIDASKARIDTLNNVTIPQIDQRIADADTALARANDDIASARGVADTANTNAGTALTRIGTEVTRIDQRIDSVSASGGYDDTAVYTEISTVKEASIGRDAALGTRVDKVFASINGDDPDGLRAYVNTTTQAAVDRDDAISERVDNLVAASDDGSGIDNYARSELNRIDRAYVSADTALGIRIDNVNTEFRGKDSATNARVNDVVTAYSSADTALAARSSLLEASYSTDNGLTPNGTFDTGTLGWTLSGAATWFDAPGDMSGVVRAEGASGALQGPRMAVQPGKSYRLRTRFASRGTGMRHYAGLRCFDLSGAYLGNIYINGVSGDAQGLAIVEKSAVLTGETNYGTAPVFVASAVAFPQNTRFVEPLFLLNQSLSGASGWLVCDVDYLYLENATDYVATDARITRTETAISDGRFAAATRASALEAQMAGAAGSNLLSRISNTETALTDGRFATAQRANNIETSVGQVSGRVSTVETATTDGRFAVASTVATLRSDYNGTAATVTTQAGTITGLESRTAAYWRVTSVAGNGRAQLTVAADANGGGGVDIGGNLSVSGNLIVDGTIITNKIAIGAVTNVLLAQSGSRSVPYSASYGSPSDGLGLTIPSPIGQVVRVEFTTDAQSNLGYVPPGYSTPPSLYYSLWRRQNGVETQLFTWSLASGFSAGRITLSFDTPASGSAVTYLIRYAFDAQGSAGGSAPVGKEILVATEIKR